MGSIKVFRRFFCLTVPKISAGGNFQSSLLSGTENVWTREGGLSRFSVEIFLSHSAENFRGESFIVALSSGIEKVWISEGEHQDFPSKFFCFTVPKNFRR